MPVPVDIINFGHQKYYLYDSHVCTFVTFIMCNVYFDFAWEFESFIWPFFFDHALIFGNESICDTCTIHTEHTQCLCTVHVGKSLFVCVFLPLCSCFSIFLFSFIQWSRIWYSSASCQMMELKTNTKTRRRCIWKNMKRGPIYLIHYCWFKLSESKNEVIICILYTLNSVYNYMFITIYPRLIR